MQPEQEQHLTEITDELRKLVSDKYRRGASEHGGNLWDMPTTELLDNAISEAIDQVVYLLTIKHKLMVMTAHTLLSSDFRKNNEDKSNVK